MSKIENAGGIHANSAPSEKINKAIERIASGQSTAAVAMAATQDEALADLKKAGAV